MNRVHIIGVMLLLSLIAGGPAQAAWLTNPDPIVIISGDTATLRMELAGFPNYGDVDQKSDVLYTGELGSWVFDISAAGLNIGDYDTATLTASLVLDDHYNVSTKLYSLLIDINGIEEFSGATDVLGLVHGAPYGTEFVNWTSRTFDASILQDPFIITMLNYSATNPQDWIAIDYLELTLSSGKPVPEPATMLLLGAGMAGLAGFRRRKKF